MNETISKLDVAEMMQMIKLLIDQKEMSIELADLVARNICLEYKVEPIFLW